MIVAGSSCSEVGLPKSLSSQTCQTGTEAEGQRDHGGRICL